VELADLSPEQVRRFLHERQRGAADSGEAEFICRSGLSIASVIEYKSTAERCMALAQERITASEEADISFPDGATFIAGELTAGQGRFRRSWYAPAGGLWLVTVIVNTLLPSSSVLYPLAAGVACCETVRHYGLNATLKWVNDVQAGGRKLAGILLETMRGPRYGEEYILIGIGLNVNNRDFPPPLQGLASSMAVLTGAGFDLGQVAARLLANLAWNIGLLRFEENKRLLAGEEETPHPTLKVWRQLSDTIGRKVRFGFNAVSSPQFTARAVDLAPDGGLVMRLTDGRLITENSGEILYL